MNYMDCSGTNKIKGLQLVILDFTQHIRKKKKKKNYT